MEEIHGIKEIDRNHYNSIDRARPVYSVEKLLKNTASLNRFKFVKLNQLPIRDEQSLGSQSFKHKQLPEIVQKVNSNRRELNSMLNRNHTKLNNSFSMYLQHEVNLCQDELRKKKITKLKKVEEQRQKQVYIIKMQRQESPYIDSVYKLMPLPNRCYDSLFPSIRYNAVLFGYEKNAYLLGGYHKHDYEELSFFHKYDLEAKRWLQVKASGESPKLSPCFHTVQIYKNNMVIIGGVSFDGEKGKKFNTELLIFNFEKNQWQKTRGSGLNLKHHASTIFGSTIIIHGGINEKEKFTQQLYFITFSGGNLSNPLFFGVKNNSDCHQKISRHKIIHTYELENQFRNQIKYDGVYSFGGQDQQNSVNNTLMFINVLGKNNQNVDIKFKKWETISTNEEKPCPRKDHSFNMINKKGIAILAGGINQKGAWLDDVWILDLVRLQWIRINTYPKIQQAFGTLAGHCACSIGTLVYFYNGNVQKKRDKAFWVLETDNSNYKPVKNIYSTKLPSFKSIASEKQNFSMSYL